MKTVIIDWQTETNNGDISEKCFDEFGKTVVYPLTPNELAAERIGDAEAVLCNKVLITADVIEKYNIEVLPFTIVFPDGSEYLEQVDITYDEFYDRLSKSEELPTPPRRLTKRR